MGKDIYLRAPRFIDHHLTEGRTEEEVLRSKIIIKKIIKYCVDNPNGRKSVIDLAETEHIEKSFIQIMTGFAQENPNFILARPNQLLYQKLIDNGFPGANIRSDAASPLKTPAPSRSVALI